MTYIGLYIIPNTEKGFLRKRNEAMLKSEEDLVMLLNDDIASISNFWGATKLFEDDPKLFAVTFDFECNGKQPVCPAAYANGGSSIYRRKIWNKLGGIDLVFEPAWWDDVELSQRAKDAGYHILRDGRIKVEKKPGLSGMERLMLNPYQYYIEKRNYAIWAIKHLPDEYKRLKQSWKWKPFVFMAERRFLFSRRLK